MGEAYPVVSTYYVKAVFTGEEHQRNRQIILETMWETPRRANLLSEQGLFARHRQWEVFSLQCSGQLVIGSFGPSGRHLQLRCVIGKRAASIMGETW